MACGSRPILGFMWQIYPIRQVALSEVVDFLWLSELYVQPHASELILPTGTVDLVIDLASAKTCRSVLSGVQSRPVRLDTSGPLSLLGARFKPGGALALAGIPAGELHNSAVCPETVWGCKAERLNDQLQTMKPPLRRFQALENFLAEQLLEKRPNDAVRYAIKEIHESPRVISVAHLARQGGMSAVRLSNLFRDAVGLTPKSYSKIVRFRRVIASIGPATGVDWTSIALDCGYCDQAHFNHDFREFTGMAPSDYLLHRTKHPNHVRTNQ
jgi:AraC-like DNA-binding protein